LGTSPFVSVVAPDGQLRRPATLHPEAVPALSSIEQAAVRSKRDFASR
jgi:hypothetical protein